ncbi:oxidoreductase [Corynebacterium humireducens NBRC 106098 = DSM 45392]|uniref:Propionate 3-nitronate monooxygenase n=1 Tax=Corynebacterium humireducens NBRC 106098 = DSM 45392 TaxID=1223515 RepID=A0A0B5D1Y4_9CORY|nr:nitronate monooxygenase [Corynebacterium humireducens]AJE32681.1 oxidoreductase [Corynebacterium humireducens NBRC 106098 = DSM 45392]
MDIPQIIVAPMAGGPSSPALVDAAAAAGSLGFLAPGGAPAALLEEQLAQVTGPYAVNLFTRQAPFESLADVRRVAGDRPLPEVDLSNDFDAKFAAVLAAERPPVVVSATFGPFTREENDALHARGIHAWVTVTNPTDAVAAVEAGADALVVQGPDAGGHRSTWTVAEEPDTRPLPDLVRSVAAVVDVPLIAAGGIRDAEDVAAALALPGVVAVSCGSAFLLADEAGTSPLNRELLAAGGRSVASRAFSGRVARGLETDFTRNNPDIPPIYPYLVSLQAAERRERPRELAYCLVGVGVEKLGGGPAAGILARLAPEQAISR